MDGMVNIPDLVEGYKHPTPPKWKKRDVFKAEEFAALDERAKMVKVTPTMTYTELATELTADLKTDLQRIRALFMWLGNQDIDGEVYPKETDNQTPKGFMKVMKNKAGTYAQFFAQLCRAAKLPCVIVRGFCKSAAYQVGDQDLSQLQGSWNAVYIDGSWQIVHPLWAFTALVGHNTGQWTKIETEGQTTKEKSKASQGVTVMQIDEDYFLPHPEEFIYKCMAGNAKWQLIKQPWDLHKFCNVPEFRMGYFTSGYKLTSPHKATLLSVNGKGEVEFTEREGRMANLSYELFFNDNQSEEKLTPEIELPRTVFFETNGNKLRLIIRYHIVGIYKLSVYADNLLVDFRLEAREKSKNENMLPINPTIGFGFGHTATDHGLMSPSHTSGVVVSQRRTVEIFTFRMTHTTQVIARMRHINIESKYLNKYVQKKTDGSNVSIRVTMPDDIGQEEYALQVYTEEETEGNNVLNYLLTNRKEDFENLAAKQKVRDSMRETRIRRNLATALILTKGVGPLERSVKEFEQADLKDGPNGYYRKAKTLLGFLKKEEQESNEAKHLKHKLKMSMKERSITNLECTIAEAEQAGHTDLDDLVASARDLVLELEQQEINEASDSVLRTQLKEAAENKEKKELEEAITEFQAAELPDKGDLKRAKIVLCQLYEEAVEDVMSKQNLEALQTLLDERESSVVSKELQESTIMGRAEKFLQQQKRIKGKLSNILDLNNSTVSEIHGYNNPKEITQDIMRASFILLGQHPKDVQTWRNIQKYLKPSNDVLKKISNIRKEYIHDNTVKRASLLLDKYTTDDVREVSAGVASFYKWSNNMIQDRSIRNSTDG